MNQIIPKANLKITSGGEPSVYSYKGDSGKSVNCYYCPKCTSHIYHHQETMGPDTVSSRPLQTNREESTDCCCFDEDHCPHRSARPGQKGIRSGCRDLRQSQDVVGEGGRADLRCHASFIDFDGN